MTTDSTPRAPRLRSLLCKMTGMILAAFAATGLQADTLTWKGGLTNAFTAAANWTSEATGNDAVPQPGDTLKVTSAATFTGTTFDIGAAGITIDNSAAVYCGVAFSGTGRLVKKGSGQFNQTTACTHFGGTEIAAGILRPNQNSAVDLLGPGKVYITGGRLQASFQNFTKGVEISGNASYAIESTNTSTFDCPVVATVDFTVHDGWGECRFYQGITATGRKVTFNSNGENRNYIIKGRIEAGEIVKKSVNLFTLEGAHVVCPKVTVEAGTVVLKSLLAFASATATVTGNARIKSNIPGAFVSSLQVGTGEPFAVGRYSAADLPNALDAASQDIEITGGSDLAYWQGGVAGAWSVGSNWSTGTAPRDGAVAVFTNGVDLACEPFDFGAGGITLVNESVIITQRTMFAGSGMYRKSGRGQIFYYAESSYTGGTTLMDGDAVVRFNYTNLVFGAKTGKVVLLRNANGDLPKISSTGWNNKLPYHFELKGALNGNYPRFQTGNCLHLTTEAYVTSDSDFTVYHAWGPVRLECPISAPGHTIRFTGNLNYSNGKDAGYTSYISSSVDASISKEGTHRMRLDGVSTGVDNKLAVSGGTLTLNTNAAWGGTNVTVAADALLVLKGNQNLADTATLTVASGGKVDVAENVMVCVDGLVVGGVRKYPGRYTASNLGAYIQGTGTIKVNGSGIMVIFR